MEGWGIGVMACWSDGTHMPLLQDSIAPIILQPPLASVGSAFDKPSGNWQAVRRSNRVTVRNFLQNLLIAFAFCLCGLIAFQWDRETKLQQQVQALTDTIHDKKVQIQDLQGTLQRTEEEVKRLDTLKNELTATVNSNQLQIAQLTKDLDKANVELERDAKQIDNYKNALEQANASIKKQNEDISKQNEELKQMATERNDAVVKYNKLVQDFNDLAKKWNEAQQGGKTNTAKGK
jgi:septal ring factor EnvC (AmiA/AmiB activator)